MQLGRTLSDPKRAVDFFIRFITTWLTVLYACSHDDDDDNECGSGFYFIAMHSKNCRHIEAVCS